jgi:hypothetical protein
MKIKTEDLTGPALDWAVAKSVGRNPKLVEAVRYPGTRRQQHVSWSVHCDPSERDEFGEVAFEPSTNWAQGGPIIEIYEIGIRRNAPCSIGREWEASGSITAKGAGYRWGYGPTPLIAAMRCYVASKLGEEVEIPDKLIV